MKLMLNDVRKYGTNCKLVKGRTLFLEIYVMSSHIEVLRGSQIRKRGNYGGKEILMVRGCVINGCF